MTKQTFTRGFTATGTWLPVMHCFFGFPSDYDSSGLADRNVSLQGYDEHDCCKTCTRVSILKKAAEIKTEARAAAEAAKALAAKEAATAAAEQEARQELEANWDQCAAIGNGLWPSMGPLVKKEASATIQAISSVVEGGFVLGGSWPACVTTNVVNVIGVTQGIALLQLTANDIDVYWGAIGDGELVWVPGGNE